MVMKKKKKWNNANGQYILHIACHCHRICSHLNLSNDFYRFRCVRLVRSALKGKRANIRGLRVRRTQSLKKSAAKSKYCECVANEQANKANNRNLLVSNTFFPRACFVFG